MLAVKPGPEQGMPASWNQRPGREEAGDRSRSKGHAHRAAELARASLNVAKAKLAEVDLSLGYTRVLAPVAGLSSRAMKSEGSLVTANDTLLTVISQVDPIWVPFNVSENDRLAIDRAVAAARTASTGIRSGLGAPRAKLMVSGMG